MADPGAAARSCEEIGTAGELVLTKLQSYQVVAAGLDDPGGCAKQDRAAFHRCCNGREGGPGGSSTRCCQGVFAAKPSWWIPGRFLPCPCRLSFLPFLLAGAMVCTWRLSEVLRLAAESGVMALFLARAGVQLSVVHAVLSGAASLLMGERGHRRGPWGSSVRPGADAAGAAPSWSCGHGDAVSCRSAKRFSYGLGHPRLDWIAVLDPLGVDPQSLWAVLAHTLQAQ